MGKNKVIQELENLCRKNGRYIEYMKDGRIATFDMYEGTDAQYFNTAEEAVEWEKGYIACDTGASCKSELLLEYE